MPADDIDMYFTDSKSVNAEFKNTHYMLFINLVNKSGRIY